jgi:hypothetical protein
VILALFIFADGGERTADVTSPPPSELEVLDVPTLPLMSGWFHHGELPAGSARRTFALEEGGPPYRYREVVGVVAAGAGVSS